MLPFNKYTHISVGQFLDADDDDDDDDANDDGMQIFGKKDNHVPPAGRDLIRKTLHEKGICFSFYEVAHAQHAFIRDELSKGRYDPFVSKVCFEMLLEAFGRTLRGDLGPGDGGGEKIEDVC